MKIGLPIIALAIITMIFVTGCTTGVVTKSGEEVMVKDDVMEKPSEEVMVKDDEQIEPMMKSDFMGMALAEESKSLYLEFDKADYDKALAENKVILLNFYAEWCPTCKAEQPEAIKGFNQLNNPDVVGFRVNYKDTNTDSYETELAKQFGISYQHTKIIIKNGERILKSPESWTAERYVSELTNA